MSELTKRAAEILQEAGMQVPEVWEGSGANGTVTAKDARKHVREHTPQDSPSDAPAETPLLSDETVKDELASLPAPVEETPQRDPAPPRSPVQSISLPMVDSQEYLVPGGDGEYQIPKSFPAHKQLEIATEALSDVLGCATSEVNVLAQSITQAGRFTVRGHYQKVV